MPFPRAHDAFAEKFFHDLVVEHPNLLPVEQLRPDLGDLLCIGRDVPTGSSGAIDNLFLSTGGYVVVAETRLWRNSPGASRGCLPVLDDVKHIVKRDYNWLEGPKMELAVAKDEATSPREQHKSWGS